MLDEDHAARDARLIESEARYRAVIENASDMIQSVLPDGTFEFVNNAWLRTLGYTEDEVPGLTIWSIIHPTSLDHCQLLFTRVFSGEELQNADAIFMRKDGEPVPVEGSVTIRRLDDKIIATHGFFRDISERLRTRELEEENARLEREKLARYLEKMAALGKLSAGLAHELNNPAAAAQRASARLSDAILQQHETLQELQAFGFSAEQWQAFHATLEQAARGEADQAPSDPLQVSEAEEELEYWLSERGVDKAWEIAPNLVAAGLNAERIEEMAAGLPPGAIGPAIKRIVEVREERDLANVILRSTRRISELVSAVKAYSYMDQAIEQYVDLHEGLENTLIILAHRLKNVTVKRDFDRELPQIPAHGSGLNQVWTNILDNAVDAVDGKGTILVRTRRDGDRAVVEITDNGSGISPENLTRVFEPFFTTKPQGEGTGLGLDIAWRIITQEHGGMLDVESQPGATTFRVSLPIAPPAKD
ncbi:MAG TPA: ATP-binding protein [Nitrolancea sp.]|nr:ATP-binding protein [Nitrolancea sp.]